jgi:hypothetical protein
MTAIMMRHGRLKRLDTSPISSYIACSTRACGKSNAVAWSPSNQATSRLNHEVTTGAGEPVLDGGNRFAGDVGG